MSEEFKVSLLRQAIEDLENRNEELQQNIRNMRDKLLHEKQKQNEGFKVPFLEQQIESLRCCGNCNLSFTSCPRKHQILIANKCCDNWRFDETTAKERMEVV